MRLRRSPSLSGTGHIDPRGGVITEDSRVLSPTTPVGHRSDRSDSPRSRPLPDAAASVYWGHPGEGLGRHGHGVDMLIMRVSDPTFGERLPDNRVVVRFRVNQQPDQTWFQTFKGHAASSVLRATNAAFRGHDVTLELTRPRAWPSSQRLWIASSSARTSGCVVGAEPSETRWSRFAVGSSG